MASPSDRLREREPGPGWWGSILADLGGFFALALASLFAGLLVNAGKRQPLPLHYHPPSERLHAAVARLQASESPPPRGEVPAVGLERFQAFALEHQGMVIDARPALIYGLGHVPGAVNLSRIDFDADYRRLGAVLKPNQTDPIAVYCSGADCQDSQLVANALRDLGFQRLFVYTEGWEEWSRSGLPQER